jgi:hypothetical protein
MGTGLTGIFKIPPESARDHHKQNRDMTFNLFLPL